MPIAKVNLSFFVKGLQDLFLDSRYQDNWWCDIMLVEVLKWSHHCDMLIEDNNYIVAARKLNLAVSKSAIMHSIDNHHTTNEAGIYRMLFKIKDDNNKPVRRMFYYACSEKNKLPKVLLDIEMAQEVYQKKLRTSPRSGKRIRIDDDAILPEFDSGNIASPTREQVVRTPTFSFWVSTEARNLFGPRDNEHVLMAIPRMMDCCAYNAELKKGSTLAYKYFILKKRMK